MVTWPISGAGAAPVPLLGGHLVGLSFGWGSSAALGHWGGHVGSAFTEWPIRWLTLDGVPGIGQLDGSYITFELLVPLIGP
uniref:Uncharacterized protein n=1 Tax=Xenopus tropicalis TaxID=8364 RepID=A0A1B8XUP3_XENTR